MKKHNSTGKNQVILLMIPNEEKLSCSKKIIRIIT